MSERQIITVEFSLPQERLDTFLRSQFPAVSRGTIQRLIEEGEIKINGQKIKPTHPPRKGDQIEIHWPKAHPAEALPEKIPLDILFEDEDLLVLNKPPGIVVHPAAGHAEHTLVNALLHHCARQLSGIGGVARPGIVHRLDKETSGCLLVAKNDETHLALAEQFSNRTIEKIYDAIVCDEVPKLNGEIRGFISRHPTQRKRMAVTEKTGREAHSSYHVTERLREATLVEIILHTGRTHQIRVHFQHLGFPVVGDETYGARQNIRLKEKTNFAAARQLLHARKLTFTHPKTGKRKTLESPWPKDFLVALKFLRKK
ncbi:MAG: RluA family pseudouridine synthase [Verrucomicrobiota bacterium]|nr:RluA family pseudouridine synthase [Verrucomicrobiota bacterium]